MPSRAVRAAHELETVLYRVAVKLRLDGDDEEKHITTMMSPEAVRDEFAAMKAEKARIAQAQALYEQRDWATLAAILRSHEMVPRVYAVFRFDVANGLPIGVTGMSNSKRTKKFLEVVANAVDVGAFALADALMVRAMDEFTGRVTVADFLRKYASTPRQTTWTRELFAYLAPKLDAGAQWLVVANYPVSVSWCRLILAVRTHAPVALVWATNIRESSTGIIVRDGKYISGVPSATLAKLIVAGVLTGYTEFVTALVSKLRPGFVLNFSYGEAHLICERDGREFSCPRTANQAQSCTVLDLHTCTLAAIEDALASTPVSLHWLLLKTVYPQELPYAPLPMRAPALTEAEVDRLVLGVATPEFSRLQNIAAAALQSPHQPLVVRSRLGTALLEQALKHTPLSETRQQTIRTWLSHWEANDVPSSELLERLLMHVTPGDEVLAMIVRHPRALARILARPTRTPLVVASCVHAAPEACFDMAVAAGYSFEELMRTRTSPYDLVSKMPAFIVARQLPLTPMMVEKASYMQWASSSAMVTLIEHARPFAITCTFMEALNVMRMNVHPTTRPVFTEYARACVSAPWPRTASNCIEELLARMPRWLLEQLARESWATAADGLPPPPSAIAAPVVLDDDDDSSNDDEDPNKRRRR